jgi:hypothetical protein
VGRLNEDYPWDGGAESWWLEAPDWADLIEESGAEPSEIIEEVRGDAEEDWWRGV